MDDGDRPWRFPKPGDGEKHNNRECNYSEAALHDPGCIMNGEETRYRGTYSEPLERHKRSQNGNYGIEHNGVRPVEGAITSDIGQNWAERSPS